MILVVHRGTGVKEQRAIAVVDDTTARPVAIVEHGAELVLDGRDGVPSKTIRSFVPVRELSLAPASSLLR